MLRQITLRTMLWSQREAHRARCTACRGIVILLKRLYTLVVSQRFGWSCDRSHVAFASNVIDSGVALIAVSTLTNSPLGH